MNERELALYHVVTDQLALLGRQLHAKGWHPELVVFSAEEECLARIPGYKVALVVPLDSVPDAASRSDASKPVPLDEYAPAVVDEEGM